MRRTEDGGKQAHARQKGTFATSRKENQGETGRATDGAGQEGEGQVGCNGVLASSAPTSLAENAEGGPGCHVICTLSQAPLAGGQERAQRQAELMQRGPIVAARQRGCSCAGRCPEVPAGRGEPLTGKAGALGLQPSQAPKPSALFGSDSGGKRAFHGSP